MSSAPIRPPRGRRGTASVLVALLGLIALAAVAVEAFAVAATGNPLWISPEPVLKAASTTRWDSVWVLVAGIVLAVIGLVVLLAGIVPPKRRGVELDSDDPALAIAVTPAGLRRNLERAALEVDGITWAGVSVGRRTVKVAARTPMLAAPDLPREVETAVARRLEALAPAGGRRLSVRVARKES